MVNGCVCVVEWRNVWRLSMSILATDFDSFFSRQAAIDSLLWRIQKSGKKSVILIQILRAHCTYLLPICVWIQSIQYDMHVLTLVAICVWICYIFYEGFMNSCGSTASFKKWSQLVHHTMLSKCQVVTEAFRKLFPSLGNVSDGNGINEAFVSTELSNWAQTTTPFHASATNYIRDGSPPDFANDFSSSPSPPIHVLGVVLHVVNVDVR